MQDHPGATLAAQLSGLGPYFAVETRAGDDDPAGPWVTFGALFEPGPASLGARIAATRQALAAMGNVPPDRVTPRVAGSIAQLGLAARVIAPVLAAIALTGHGPGLDAESLWWQPVLGGPAPLSLPVEAFGPAGLMPAAEAVHRLLTGPIGALVAATEELSVPATVLWGNVASGVGGAVDQVTLRRPDLDAAAVAAAETFLRHPLLAGTADGAPGFDFRRRSCCLIYQLGPAGPARYCADCILRSRG